MANRFIILGSLFMLMCAIELSAQSVTVLTPGNWSNSLLWASGNIGDQLTEQVSFAGSSDAVTISSGNTFTVGALNLGSNTLQIDGALEVGSATVSGSFIAGNNATITINGSLTIWGPLTLGDGTRLVVNGSLIVKGLFNSGQFGTFLVGATGSANFLTVNLGGFTTFINHGVISITWSIILLNPMAVTNSGRITANSCLSVPEVCPIILPVELLFFRGTMDGDRIQLQWATASEKDFDKFVIEQSLDGMTFEPIGEVVGAGNSVTRNDYRFYDNWPPPGTVYYRLAIIDLDGVVKYSHVLAIKSTVTNNIRVYPNPVISGRIRIELNFVPEQPTLVTLKNSVGNNAFRFLMTTRSEWIELPALEAGVYFLSIAAANEVKTVRLVVQ